MTHFSAAPETTLNGGFALPSPLSFFSSRLMILSTC